MTVPLITNITDHSSLQNISLIQNQASNPQANIWVRANAGSGKTHILTQRVIRLLLNGTEPSHILCLTYTKAAASVMQQRIFDSLSAWTRLNDEDLARHLSELEGKPIDKPLLKTARTLFARAIETPGGLKIQTIHAFCEALLHQFPLETHIASHFTIMDDMQKNTLINDAKKTILTNLYDSHHRNQECADNQAFKRILNAAGAEGLETLFTEVIAKRHKIQEFCHKTPEEQKQILFQVFGLATEETSPHLIMQLKQTALFPEEILSLLLEKGGENSKRFASQLQALQSENDLDSIQKLCLSAYFTEKQEKRKAKPIITKSLTEIQADLTDLFLEKQEISYELLEKIKAIELIEINCAAYHIIKKFLNEYEQQKKLQNLLDFDDLIDHCLALLKSKDAYLWVHYKLDRGIDHILVDEAQDTSPEQWEIIRLLSHDFFSNSSYSDQERTLFAVGDEKQSIYSFQGAVPEDFKKNGQLIEQKAKSCQKQFHTIRLDFSFRSTRDILSAVDCVFASPETYEGVSMDNVALTHAAIRLYAPGRVDLWEPLTRQKIEEPEDWRKPVDALTSPPVRLAEAIADTIAHWLKNNEILAGKNRIVRAQDIIILVRKRDQFVDALSRALKKRHIAVSGVDRLHLTDHIAIRDLIALGNFILQPQDDLSLACILKSPLFSVTEEQLFSLCYNRPDSLINALKTKAETCPFFAAIVEELAFYQTMVNQMPVFEFYSLILSSRGGRRKILARLGTETNELLDAFLDYSIAVQQAGTPGLRAFLKLLTDSKPEIKRESNQTRDEVKIMTVHAAKGLEAGIIFLVDPGSPIWNSQYEPKLLAITDNKTSTDPTSIFLWQPNKQLKTNLGQQQMDRLKKRAAQEYRRLLYVAMTRAEDRLILCGYCGEKANPESWLSLLSTTLIPQSQAIPSPAPGIIAWRYSIPVQNWMPAPEISEPPAPYNYPPAPDYLYTTLSPSETPTLFDRIITPSNIFSANISSANIFSANLSSVITDTKIAQPDCFTPNSVVQKGSMIHKLLQYLPSIPKDKQGDIAYRMLQYSLPEYDPAEYHSIINNIVTLMEDPQLSPLFSNSAKAEVALQGTIETAAGPKIISGQIDRLAILKEEILLAEFKTGFVAKSLSYIPFSQLLQMACYLHLIAPLYSGKTIRPILIYTSKPVFFVLNEKKLHRLLQDWTKNPQLTEKHYRQKEDVNSSHPT